METLIQDLRYGARQLLRQPGFTLVAVLTLALGIGANTALFSLLNAMALRPLPVERPQELVALYSSDASGTDFGNSSYPDYMDWRDRNTVFSGLAAHDSVPLNLSVEGHTERIQGEIVTGNYFTLLGVKPVLGRAFLPEEDATPATHFVAVLSYGLWQRRFGADPEAVGKRLILNGQSFTVVGVAPKGFAGIVLGETPQAWVPMMTQAVTRPRRGLDLLTFRGSRWLSVVGRLKADVSLAQADAALDAIARQLQQAYPRSNEGYAGVASFPASEARIWPSARGAILSFVGMLNAVAAIVLLIACANVANLLLAQAATRRREVAVRLAIGAGRGRLLRQLLTETVLLWSLGGAAGILLALWASDFLLSLRPPSLPLDLDLPLDARVLGFSLGVSLLTGLTFGLIPAFQASRTDLVPALKESSRAVGPRRGRLRSALVVSQVALSLLLLVGAGLFLRSLGNARATAPGFRAEGVLLASVDLRLNQYTDERGQQFYQQLLERLQALPGAESAGLAEIVPLGIGGMRSTLTVDDYQPRADEDMNVDVNIVSRGYFDTMGVPLVLGRDFTGQDRTGAPGVVIVNEAFTRRFWPGEDPLGKRIHDGGPENPALEVVGVVKDGKYRSLRETGRPHYFLPLGQNYSGTMTVHVRTGGRPDALLPLVRREVEALDPNLPLFNVKTLRQHLGIALFPTQVAATLLGVFGGLGLALVAVGLYGVMSYGVSQRTHEIGIRMALGAQPGNIFRLVVGQGMVMAAVGLAAGLAGAWGLTRLVRSFLFGVTPTDPLTFAGVSALLAGVALLACWIPARRATRVDPLVALRYE